MSQVDAPALLAIIALSASPVGEILVAIPAELLWELSLY